MYGRKPWQQDKVLAPVPQRPAGGPMTLLAEDALQCQTRWESQLSAMALWNLYIQHPLPIHVPASLRAGGEQYRHSPSPPDANVVARGVCGSLLPVYSHVLTACSALSCTAVFLTWNLQQGTLDDPMPASRGL